MRNAGACDPSHKLGRCHQEQLELCRELELIADGLPSLPATEALQLVDGLIVPMMRRFARQWAATFAALAVAASDTPFAPLLDDLARQDQDDIGQAEEIQATIDEMKSAGGGLCAEGLGYLLRGFITARRRRVTLDRTLLGSSLFDSAPGFPAREGRPTTHH